MALHLSTTARRAVTFGVAVAVLAGGGVAVAASRTSTHPAYRTAVVGHHEVAHELTGVATIEPVSQASVAFPVAGTVSAVAVQVGDPVSTGQSLATLNTASLQATLLQSQAALDTARLNLAKALAGEPVSSGAGTGSGAARVTTQGASATTTSSTATASGSSTGVARFVLVSRAGHSVTTPTRPTTPTSPKPPAVSVGLERAQQAVLDAQSAVDQDLARATKALDGSTRACAAVSAPITPTSSTTTPSTTTSSTTTTTTPATGVTQTAACQQALADALAAQRVVATDQAALSKASTALDSLLAKKVTAPSTTTPTTPARTGSGTTGRTGSGASVGADHSSTASRSGSSAAGGPSAGSTGTASLPTSAELVAYQKAVDAAAATVAVAGQGVQQAAIVSPIDGTVASVGLARGDAVTAASATAAIVIVGKGGYEVTTTVTVEDLSDLQIGQAARIVPDGSSTSLSGKVVAIGVAADTSGATATYPITIGVTGQSSALRNGATASTSIITSRAVSALAVPTSAITSAGSRHVVTVIADGKTTATPVQLGVRGDRWTAITSGVTAGQTVVLANLGEPLPGSATDGASSTATTNRFGGGFGGRGFGGFGARPGG